MADINQTVNIMIQVTDKATKEIQNTEKSAKKLEFSLRGVQRAFLSIGLSFLFSGMALRRFFENFLRQSVDSYMKMADANSKLLKDVLSVQASWEFLKYSIVDALSQTGLLELMADVIRRITDYLNNLSPEAKEKFVKIAIGAIILGSAMMVFGQVLLFVIGLITLLDILISPLGAALLIIAATILLLNSNMDETSKVLVKIAATISLLTIGLLVLGVAVGATFILFLAGLALLLIVLVGLKSKYETWGRAFQSYAFTIVNGVAWIVAKVIDLIVENFRIALDIIIRLINIANRIPGINISTKGIEDVRSMLSNMGEKLILNPLLEWEQSRHLFPTAEEGAGLGGDLKEGFANTLSDLIGDKMMDVFKQLGSDFFAGEKGYQRTTGG